MKLCVDIDGTLFESDCIDGEYEIRKVNREMIKRLNALFDTGSEIVIYTGRHWNHLYETKRQLDSHNIKYTTLVMGKPVADHYIDDKAVRPDEFLAR
jgi:hydroxymethylpyrimidine pyrophosphatase-like HAD family hydrolase